MIKAKSKKAARKAVVKAVGRMKVFVHDRGTNNMNHAELVRAVSIALASYYDYEWAAKTK